MEKTAVVECMDRSETRSESLGEKRRLENGVDRNLGNKKARGGGEDVGLGSNVRKVAEIVLVLATMGKMRGGRKPTPVEAQMMSVAREELAYVCKDFAPKDVFSRDALGTVIEDLGLNRLREQRLGIRIAQKLQLAKQKMEKPEVFLLHSNMYTPPWLQSNLSGATENRGTFNIVQMFPSDKANHAPVSSGSFQHPSNVVHGNISTTNSRILPYQLPTSEVRPGLSNTIHMGRDPSSLPVARAERPQFRLDGGANGSCTSQSQAISPEDHMNGKTPTWSIQPHSASFAKVGSDKVPAAHTSKQFTTHVTSTPMNVNHIQHHMNFTQAPSAADNHCEISKIVQKVLHSNLLDHPTWTPPSRDYMNKALTCQTCKGTINEVDTTLVCDACERGYHLKCLHCNPKALPRGEWHCAKCLAISNGKPLPPKYGRVTRNITTLKLSSNSIAVQPSLDYNANVNQQTRTPNEKHEYQNNSLSSNVPETTCSEKNLECGLKGEIKEDEAPSSSSISMDEVEWIGGVVKEIDGKTYYDSCCINGTVYKLKDYALFSSPGKRYLPNKLQAMWEDDETTKKWVTVTRCFFPDDLPQGVGRPCAPERNEVYESNHESTLAADLIHGPCEVLPPSKFSEESVARTHLRARSSDKPKPLFLCKWFYDEIKRLFRDVTC